MSTKPNQRPHGQVGTKEPRFAAFEVRNFRRYFIGQIISSVGSWTQALAVTCARRRCPAARRPRSSVARRSTNDDALRPCATEPGPARHLHRVDIHRRSDPTGLSVTHHSSERYRATETLVTPAIGRSAPQPHRGPPWSR